MSYCLLDAARMEVVFEAAKEKAGQSNYLCLYRGNTADHLSNVAPYLFVSQPPSFIDWLFAEGWGNAWGVYVLSRAEPMTLYTHFRRFLTVKNQSGKSLYFRFYDPRVLRSFLPTCTPQELADFFGPVHYFMMEDPDPDYSLSFWLEQGQLQVRRMPRADTERDYRKYVMLDESM